MILSKANFSIEMPYHLLGNCWGDGQNFIFYIIFHCTLTVLLTLTPFILDKFLGIQGLLD